MGLGIWGLDLDRFTEEFLTIEEAGTLRKPRAKAITVGLTGAKKTRLYLAEPDDHISEDAKNEAVRDVAASLAVDILHSLGFTDQMIEDMVTRRIEIRSTI